MRLQVTWVSHRKHTLLTVDKAGAEVQDTFKLYTFLFP